MKKRQPTSPRAPRAYRSPLREQQARDTREAILRALVEQIGHSRPGEFALSEVAARAGVSIRTVYRHFGSREQALRAIDAYVAERHFPAIPADPAGLAGWVPELFAAFDANAPWVEAMLRVGSEADLRRAGKPRRVTALRRALAPALVGVDPVTAESAVAVVKHLLSAEAWRTLREDFGMDGVRAGGAVGWALQALLAELNRSRTETTR